ncbi:Bug family tripartite tricarboxylate transporter substrate binding protein [Teichococcus oryzae]|uniref:Tripartite tricarboxylate transporter substrate binding protein n=1 Tax=Teichococcus oryzae TaxID=1608942 RepID=A0A5B2TE53_9PROT|nr:tripartite tricarboxylate transporter substrate-binding protein [Pseudoroseomonas oryzae]KAA2212403.1 tripartite tricarboxylate transporter substrate binding protein [Pseudoroseomonas oryzae]
MRRRILMGAALAAPALAACRAARAAAPWPSPVALVVPFTAGGSTDIAARVLAERMGPRLGPQVRIVVENRAGAGGSVGSDYVRYRPADGSTLLMATASSHGSNPAALPDRTPYHPVRDFSPVAVVGGGPLVVVVPQASRFPSVAALFAALREKPGDLHWATSGVGGIGHLTGEAMLVRAGGLKAEHVPYRGGAQVMEALAKGEVDFSLEVLASAAPHLRDGVSRGLAVTGAARHPLLPDVPSLAEAGLTGFDITTWNVLLGPPGLSQDALTALSAAANAALAEPDVRRRLTAAGVDPAGPSTPASTGAFLQEELAKFQEAVRSAGLKLDG